MKQTIKKGFTLVELLFVMAIISILAGFAIANLNDSTKVATLNSMKSDARNAMSAEQLLFSSTHSYQTLSCTEGVDDNNGLCTSGALKLSVSKGNRVVTVKRASGNSYQVYVTNPVFANQELVFDSRYNGTFILRDIVHSL